MKKFVALGLLAASAATLLASCSTSGSDIKSMVPTGRNSRAAGSVLQKEQFSDSEKQSWDRGVR